jgi:hypothetical protein
MSPATAKRRAIGIVRVSQKEGREGESFVSPEDQRDRIRAACDRDGLQLVDVYDELDVSGATRLDDRPELGPAVVVGGRMSGHDCALEWGALVAAAAGELDGSRDPRPPSGSKTSSIPMKGVVLSPSLHPRSLSGRASSWPQRKLPCEAGLRTASKRGDLCLRALASRLPGPKNGHQDRRSEGAEDRYSEQDHSSRPHRPIAEHQ